MTESLTLDIVDRLRKRLHDASPQVRQAAATGLAALSPDIFPDVIRNDEAMARVSAIEYLAQTQRLEASQLQVAIKGLSDTGIAAAVRAASQMPVASDTWTVVAECLQHDAPEVRLAAAESLGASMAAQWIEPLIACLGDSIIRQAALNSLTRLGWSPDSPEGQATLALASRDFTRLATLADAAIPQIEAAFRAGGRDRDSVELRAALCEVIAPIASKHVDRLLAECLNDVGSSARAAAARALGTRGKSVKKTVRSSLRALLDEDPNARVRLAAAVTLGQLQDTAAVDVLEAASTHDESPAVRYAASEALGHLGHHEHLIRALHSPETTIRRDAAQQLGALKVYAAIDPLIDTLTDVMATVRSAAFNALETLEWTPVGVKIGPTDERYSRWMTRAEQLRRAGLDASNPVDQAALLAMDLQAPDPLVRQAALEALANRKDKKLKTLALPLLDDSDPYVRTCAAETVLRLDAVPTSGPLRASWLVATGRLAEAAALGPDANAALSREAREGTSDRRAEAVRVMAPLEGEDITSTLHAALQDDVSFVRTNAILSLSVRGEPSAIEALQALLGDDHSVIRRTAGQCLLRLGDSGIDAAQQSLSHDDALVRQTVAEAIAANAEVANTLVIRLHAALDGETANTVQEALLNAMGAAEDNAAPFWTSAARLLRDSPHYKVRLAAAAALGRMRVADASSALCEALGDTYVSVRKAALDALPHVGWKASGPTARAMVALAEEDWRGLSSVGTASIPLLRQTLNESSADGPSVRRREYAIQALVEIGTTVRKTPAQVRAIRDILLERLHDVGGRARAAAAQGLGVLDAGEVGQALLQVAQHDANEHARVSALIALGRCGDKEMSEALLAISRTDPSQNVRIAASQALAGPAIGDIASLILALSSPDAPVRQRAAMELGGLDNPEAIDPLIERLGDADTGVRAAARRSLNTLGWEPVGIRGGHDEPGYRRWLSRAEVTIAAGEMTPDVSQTDVLLGALQNDEESVRRAALDTIAAQRARTAVPDILAALRDPEHAVRRAAADALVALDAVPSEGEDAAYALVALGRILEVATLRGDAEAALLLASEIPDAETRAHAVSALHEIGTDAGYERCLQAVSDPSPIVRTAAVAGLDPARSDTVLRTALQDTEQMVVDAAADALITPETDEAALMDALSTGGPAAQIALIDQLAALQPTPALLTWLVSACESADHPGVRHSALLALDALSPDDMLDLAPVLAVRDPDATVRICAVHAIQRSGQRAHLPTLLTALGDEYSDVRAAVIQALETFDYTPEDGIAEATLALAKRDWDLLRTLGSDAAQLIERALHDRDMDPDSQAKRASAVETLGYLRCPESNAGLHLALCDPSARVRSAAVDAVVRLRRKAFGPSLVERLASDTDAKVRARAASGIGALAYTKGAVTLSSAASHDPEPLVRSAAAIALAGPGIGRTERLIAQLGDADPELRRQAAVALSPLKDHRALDPLVSSLADAYSSVRAAAKGALDALDWEPIGLKRDPESTGYIRWLLRQELVSTSPEPSQVEVLLGCHTHEDRMVRYAAVETLQSIGSGSALSALAHYTDDQDRAVASLAQSAISAIEAQRRASTTAE